MKINWDLIAEEIFCWSCLIGFALFCLGVGGCTLAGAVLLIRTVFGF